jgi:hypothetical protein
MNGQAARERGEVTVACDWAALTTEHQERQQSLHRQLRADVKEVRELDDGYAFRHSSDRAVLLALAEFVANERLCCPFFEFRLTVERVGGPVWLRITGEGEAKRVLEAEMGSALEDASIPSVGRSSPAPDNALHNTP